MKEYRAVVADVNLKGTLSGWELARQLRQREPTFPVVYMTGAAANDWGSQGVPNSILLQKPFAPAQLVTAVSKLLNEVHRRTSKNRRRHWLAQQASVPAVHGGRNEARQ